MHYTLCDMILDLIQNSVEAGAKLIELRVWREAGRLHIDLQDDGCGMDEAELAKASDPFYSDGIKHPQRKVGLGLPFVLQTAELCGGSFALDSAKGRGTTLQCSFDQANIDTPPEGDWSAMLLQAMCFDGDYDLAVDKGYTVRRSELQEILGDFSEARNMLLLRDFLRSQEAADE